MPLEGNVRYRVKDGIRLAFRGNQVIETKKLAPGHVAHKVHPKSPHNPGDADLLAKLSRGRFKSKDDLVYEGLGEALRGIGEQT